MPLPGQVNTGLIVDPAINTVLAAQGFLPDGFAGGYSAGGNWDSGGSGGSNPLASSNPTPSGGWASALQSLANDALKAFQTYEAGSPSAATPQLRQPGVLVAAGSPLLTASGFPSGVLIAAGLGLIILVLLVR